MGNLQLMQAFNIKISDEVQLQLKWLSEQARTPMLVSEGKQLLGLIAVADPVREDSQTAISRLQASCIRVAMLTGYNKHTA